MGFWKSEEVEETEEEEEKSLEWEINEIDYLKRTRTPTGWLVRTMSSNIADNIVFIHDEDHKWANELFKRNPTVKK